jgi:hypothetical protein
MGDTDANHHEEASLEKRLDHITHLLETAVGELGQLKGRTLEMRVRSEVSHFLRGLMVPARVVEFEDALSVIDLGAIEPADLEALERLDLIAEGTLRSGGPEHVGTEPVYLAAEISWRADGHDVRRAADRARILASGTGRACLAAVLAEDAASGQLLDLARELGVAVVDGDGSVRERGQLILAPTVT